ncbi:hypothetical protein CJF42_19570 [Pseudoalteromonas sp. NBT06-2]|uniref:hypothetical protein n=1 Tax=Pseudoalteromonas sp. NBT06-2 TaxID=2025950 RepID=UPI000BA6875C|nr:hypothetical protein [Pseudoalteromonas sp. NBT06-2]PAJ72754.1 hypothetical protein CJF42_19570 [Pseudoalteromonas sp. NBT06-2]
MNNVKQLEHLLQVAKLINAYLLKLDHEFDGILSVEEESSLIQQKLILEKKKFLLSNQISTVIGTRTAIRSPSSDEVNKVKQYLANVESDTASVSSARDMTQALIEGIDYIAKL